MRPRLLGLVLLVGCYSADSHAVSDRADASASGITIAIPIETVDCDEVTLAVVGAKRAVVGERVTMQASTSGMLLLAESDAAAEVVGPPALLWSADDLDLTVTGPSTADVLCGAVGSHSVTVQLAPPSPCPAALHLTVECVAAAHDDSSDS